MVITDELRTSVLELYTAYFNRAADTAGVDYWVNEMVSKNWTMLDVAASFADQDEFSDVYGGLNNSQIVTTVYNNVLGRSPDQSGEDYWVGQLESGAISVENLITAVINAATEVVNGEPVNAVDKDMVDNKTAASEYLYNNNNSQTDILLDSITDNDDTLVDFIANLEDNGIDGSINNVYTLTENAITTVTPAVDGEVITQMVTYWGDGVENGVPVGDLLTYIAGLADTTDGVNALLAKLEDIGVITDSATDFEQGTDYSNLDFSNVTGMTLNDGGFMSISYENNAGEIAQAEVDLGALYEGLVRDLIFDENGNSRLFEAEVAATTLWIDAAGTSGYPTATITVNNVQYDNVVVDAQGNPIEITAMSNGTAAVTTTVTTPIILTTDVNNGGTEENGYTSAADDTIVAGRLDLLHGAYIDAGAGENTLEIDAKGYFAQPKELLNIQTINVENLANVYTDANGNSIYPTIQDAAAITDSIIDLSRADELTSLTITEGSYGNTLDDNLGTLSVSGVRADATLTLEGQFTQAVTVSYSEGLSTNDNGLDLVLRLGDTTGATFDILSNSATVNIDSQGGGNAIDATFTVSSLLNMNISGDAKLQITNSLSPSFQAGTPATIDASANTAGVDLTINDFNDEVVFTGTAADDHFNANLNGKSVLVNSSTGDDEISANNGQIVTINAAEGNNEISATNAAVSAIVTATDGNNIVDVSNSTVATVTLGDGNNNVTADTVTDLSVTAGNGNNTIESVGSTTANITTADGSDTITVSAEEIIVNSGMGDDTVSVAGTLGGGVAAAGGAINLMLLLDNSGSLSAQQLADTKAATIALLDQYQAAGTNVMVNVMSFSPDITGTNDWVSIADAKAEINLLDASGSTDFDTALTDAIAEWATTGKIAGATNQIAFTSDGQSSIQASTVTAWETFLNNNDITANAFGMGAGTSTVALDPIAFDGVSNTPLNAIVVDDSSDLTDAMATAVTGAMTGNDAVITIDLGEGYNTLILGDSNELSQGLTALEGSTITGENVTLVVNQDSDIQAIEDLSAITSVILDNNEASSTVDTDNAVLTLTAAQFVAIGAANFSVEGAVFNTYSQIEVIVTESTSLTDLGVDSLASNIDLKLVVNDGVTLEMTAEQLHTNVAANGVTLVNDNNTDVENGNVIITGAGEDFDPFNTSDTIQSNIAGTVYVGGSLSDDFMSGTTSWYNVTLDAVYKGYDRPVDVAVEQVLTIDTDILAGEAVETIDTWHTNLLITGTQDVDFDGVLQLGEVQGDATNPFNIDFSSLDGTATNMTIDHFEMLGQGGSIIGNADAGYDSVVNVKINADVDNDNIGFDETDAQSLVSSGVTKYVVTSIDGTTFTADTATIKLCDTTHDLETIALQGNYEDTLVVEDAAWGLGFELQGGSTLKADGPTGTSNVGFIQANYMWPEANANVDIIHSIATDTRPLAASGIEITNASTITVNTESDTTIGSISDGAETTLESLVLSATGDLTIITAIETAVTSIDASATTGDLTISSAITSTDASDFTFVGSAGTTTLTMTADFVASDATSFTSAGTLDLIISDGDTSSITTDLTAANVADIDSILVGAGDTLNLTIAQANTIDPANITGENGSTSNLVLSDLAEEKFVKADYDIINLNFTSLEVIAEDTVTLHADTDLTGIETLLVNDGTTLNLTAAQFQQLTNEGTITAANGFTSDFTINITDLTQADVDNGFDLSGIDTAATVILNLAESIDMPSVDTNGHPIVGSVLNADVINMGDDMMLTVNTFEEVDGTEINGGVNSTLKFTDSVVDGDDQATGIQYPSIDASGFDITNILFLNLVSGDINVDEDLFVNLPSGVTKVVYNGEGMATALSQTVTIQEQGSIDGTYTAFNKSGDDQNTVEITDFTINLEGGVNIAGDLELSTAAKDNTFTGNELLKQGLQTVTINSTGTAANLFTGETVNVMGTLTPRGDNVTLSTDNTLTDVVINAEQALEMDGIVFNSWSEANTGEADGWTINDDDAATATVTINGSANVALGLLDSSDDEVDAMVVNNVGTGTVTATIDAANIDDDSANDNVDALSFTGSNIELTIVGTVNLSDDDLSGVTLLTFDNASVVTMSQAQVDALGAANIVVDDSDAATLNIVEFGSTPFDATTFDEQLDIHTIVMAAGTNTLNGDFTDVDQIVVPEGGVLNLTATQFQQLVGNGSIVSYDANGDLTIDPITVNITDLTQADIDAGSFVTTDIAAGNTVTLSLAEDIILSTDDVIETIDTVIMADGQTLSVVTQAQADGLVTDAGINTAINLEYDVNSSAPIDASGYDVSKVDVWSNAVDGSDVEFVIDNLPNDVVLHIVESALQISDVADVNRQVVIEEGVAVPGFLVFNGDDNDRELETLEITFSGDASDRTEDEDFDGNLEGSIITGNLEFDFDADTLGDSNDYFTKLTLNSTGTGTSNGITGDITPLAGVDADGNSDNSANNLLDVEINADANFTIGGDIVFNGINAADDTATLTVNGDADVSIQQLVITGANIDTLNVANDGTGTLTVTGASPAVDSVSLETIVFSGTGAIVLDTDAVSNSSTGIDGDDVLSTIDASTLSGDLTLGDVHNVDAADFAFTSGTGVTTVNFEGVTLNADVDGDTVATIDDGTGFSIDVSNAAVGTEVHLGANTYTDGALNINLGANGTLFIDANTDFTALDILNISQVNAIVLADEVTLTLTAEQANTLNIIGVDTDNDGIFGTVTVVDLGTAAVDLSGISADIAGTTYLDSSDDVTLDAATNLGDFSVTLIDSDATAEGMLGQTIRFQDETQAAREVIVDATTANLADTGAGVDTNVVWLFDTITDSVNTGNSDITPVYDYDVNLGRLWVTEDLLANNNNVEDLFTTLPSTIVRVEFTDLNELNYALGSNGIDRTVEMVAFTDLSATGLTFSDSDRFEDIDTLTLNLGGQVQTGDIVLDNIIAPSADPLELDPTGIAFTGLTINSYLVDNDQHFLAPELFVNDNGLSTDVGIEAGEHELPNEINTIGNISVGANNGVDLLTVDLNTVQTNLTVGTITFDAETPVSPATNTATLNVSGAYTTTVASLNTTDADIATLAVVNAGSGALVVTGASPAAAVSDTETLTIEVQTGTGSVTLGTAGDATKPGISSAELSLVTVTGSASGTDADVDLGLIANVDGIAQVDTDGITPITSFELNTTAHDGTVSAVFGDASAAPVLADDAIWEFTNGTTGELNLTFTDDVVLGAGDVTFTNVTMTINGAVDFTTLNELTLSSGTTIDVPAGSSLTILAEDADGLTVTGDGVVNIVDVEAVLTADYSNVMTTDGDTGTVNVLFDTTDGDDVDLLPDDLVFIGNLGKAIATVTGDGSLDVTGAILDAYYDADDSDLTGDINGDETVMASFVVDAAATLIVTAAQGDARTVSGAGTTNVEDISTYANANDIDLSGVASNSVNIAVDNATTLDMNDNLGAAGAGRVVTIADGVTLTSAGSVVDGQFIVGENAILLVDDENDTNGTTILTDTPITADLSNVTAEFITLVPTAEVGTITFPVLYGDPVAKYEGFPSAIPAIAPDATVAVQTVTMTADQASNQTITGANADTEGEVVVNDLVNNTDISVPADSVLDVALVDFSNIAAGELTAYVPGTATLHSASDLGTFDVVVATGTFTLTAGQADTLNITETAAATIAVTDLEDTPNADLSNIVATTETAALDANGGVTLGANLGTNMVVTVEDSVVGGDTVTFTGTLNPNGTGAGTTFELNGEDLTLVLDAADANLLTVTDTTVPVAEVSEILFTGTMIGGDISVDVGGVTVTVPFNTDNNTTLGDLATAINIEMANQGYTTTSVAFDGTDTIDIVGDANGTDAPAITNIDVSLANNISSGVLTTTTVADNSNSSVVIENLGSDLVDFTAIDNTLTNITANVPTTVELDVNSDLALADVVLAEGVELTLTADQFQAVTAPDFTGTTGGATETLVVTQATTGDTIDSNLLDASITIARLEVLDTNTAVTLGGDFTNVQEIVIPEGTTLNLTADQFMQLPTGTVSGLGTLNITGLNSTHGDIDLSNVTAVAGTIYLDAAAGIVSNPLDTSATSTDAPIVINDAANLGSFAIEFTADDQGLTLSNETQADGRTITKDSNVTGDTSLILGFTSADATDANAVIDASNYAANVSELYSINEYLFNEFTTNAADANFEEIYDSLDTNTNITVIDAEVVLNAGYTDPTVIATIDRTITIDANTTLDATAAFNDINDPETEVRDLTLNLSGNSVITGDLKLQQNEDPQDALANGKLITFFDTLTINSNGSVLNEIKGDIYADQSAILDTESEVETFTLTLDSTISVDGTEDQIMFDSEVIQLGNGDDTDDVAALIVLGNYENWYTLPYTPGDNQVTFVNKLPGNVTDTTIGDFTFNINNPGTQGLDLGDSGIVAGVNGSFNSNENNLLDVIINTGTGADLNIDGRVEFSYVSGTSDVSIPLTTDDRTSTASITITGNDNVTIGALDTQDAHITALTMNHTGTGTVAVLGTSPAAAVGDTEILNINTEGTITLGTAGDDAKPGVLGEELSAININTDNTLGIVTFGSVDLGVISAIDQNNFAMVVGAGSVTAILDSDADSNNPILANGGTWSFTGTNGMKNLTLTVSQDVDFGNGTTTFDDVNLTFENGVDLGDGDLFITDTALTIEGTVDFSNLNSITVSGSSTITIPTGTTLTMTAELAAGLTFYGDGTLELTGVADAADINAIIIGGGATVDIDGSNLTDINGDITDINSAYTLLTTVPNTAPINFDSMLVDDTVNGNDAVDITTLESNNGTGLIDGSALTTLNGTAAEINQALADLDVDPTPDFNSTLTGPTTDAADIIAILAANGAGTIDATNVTTLTGSGSDIAAVIGDADVTNLPGNVAINVTGTLTVADEIIIDGLTTGIITAAIAEGDMATLAGITDANTNNALTVVITDTMALANELNTLDSKTTVQVDATALTSIIGDGSDIVTAVTAPGILTSGTEDVFAGNTLDVADQITIDSATTGIISGTITEGDMAALNTIVDANANNALTVVITDTTAIAADLNALDAKTTVAVDATALTSITGAGSDIATAVTASGINDSGTEDITVDSGNLAVADQIIIDGATTGIITATIAEGDMATLAGITDGSANNALTVVITDSSVDAAALITLDGKTSVAIDTQSNVTTITGSAADVLSALGSTGVSFTAGINIVINDAGSIAASTLTALSALGTGSVTSAGITEITGTRLEVQTALDDANLVSLAAVNATVSNAISASQQATMDATTTGIITVTISDGDMTSLALITDANGNNALTITVTDPSVDAAALNIVDGKTSVAVATTAAVTTLTGAAVDVIAAYAAGTAGTITGLGDEAVTLSGNTSVADVNTVTGDTSGVVTATVAATDISTLNTLTSANTDMINVVATTTTLNASDAIALDAKTGVAVDVTAATTLLGSTADVLSYYSADSSGTINSNDDENVALLDSTITANDLNSIDGDTSGDITALFGDLDITDLSGQGVNATNANDTFIFAAGDASVTITDFDVTGNDVFDTYFVTTSGNFTFSTEAANSGAALNIDTTVATGNGVHEFTGAFAGLDFTNMTDVLASISNADISVSASGDSFMFILNDGTDSYLYEADDASSNNIQSNEITLVGTFNSADLDTGDIA